MSILINVKRRAIQRILVQYVSAMLISVIGGCVGISAVSAVSAATNSAEEVPE